MAISQALTLSDTGASCPLAYGRIDDSLVSLSSGLFQITLNWFATQDVASQRSYLPVRVDKILIPGTALVTPNEYFVKHLQRACANGTIVTPQDALKTALYIIIQQLSAYEESTFV